MTTMTKYRALHVFDHPQALRAKKPLVDKGLQRKVSLVSEPTKSLVQSAQLTQTATAPSSENPLTSIILSNTSVSNIFYAPPIESYILPSPDAERDYETGAAITHTPSSQMSPGVLGEYRPSQHSITLNSDMASAKQYQWVNRHERRHAYGLFSEHKNDADTSAYLGENRMREFNLEGPWLN